MITLMFLIIVVTLIDQISKLIIIKKLIPNISYTVIKNFFYLTYTNNTGAAFSILTGKRVLLIAIAIIIIGLLFYYFKKNKINSNLEKLSFAFIIGGALGNLIDRIIRGYVVDFIDIKIFGYNYPIFNLADVFIVIGVFLLLIIMIRKDKKYGSKHSR